MRGSLGSQRVHIPEGLARYFSVKKDNRIESLVLGAGGHFVAEGQVSQEVFEFFLTGKVLGHVLQRSDISA